MRRLSSLGSRQLSARKGRSLLTALGIVLGVAVLVGVLVSNATAAVGVDRLITDLVGRSDVIVSRVGGLDATAPLSSFTPLYRADDVDVIAFSLNSESAVRGNDGSLRDVTFRGIDARNIAKIQPVTFAEGGWFSAGEDEVLLPERLAADLALAVGDQVRLATPNGLVSLRLVGILEPSGLGASDTGEVAFTSLLTMQELLDKPGEATSARIDLADGTDVSAWIDEYETTLGDGFEFREAGELAGGFRSFLELIGAVFTVFAGISLFIGAFLIYLTLTTAVVERTRVYGTLRALGTSHAQLRRTVLLEAAALGTVSPIVGAGVGLVLAKGLLALLQAVFDLDFGALVVEPGAIAVGMLVGIVTTIVAALVPARRAARLEPTQAMLGGTLVEARRSKAPIVGGVLTLLGAFGAFLGQAWATPLLLIGAVLVTPLLLPTLAAATGRITDRIVRGLGPIAVLHLVKERSRSGYTLGLVMTVLATILAIAGLSASMLRTVDAALDAELGADLFIDPAGTVAAGFEDEVRGVNGVAATTAIGFAPATLRTGDGDDLETFARVIDPSTYFEVSGFVISEGSLDAARAGLQRGGAALMPQGQASQHGFEVGDEIVLETGASSTVPFVLVATYSTVLPVPEIVLSRNDGATHLGVTGADALNVQIAADADADDVASAIDAALGERYAFEIRNPSDLKQDARADFATFFSIFYAIVAIAGLVGLLGMANTLAVSVLQRTREIGVLRAIGASRRQVRVMILVEAITMSTVALVLAVPLGFGLGVVTLAGFRDAFGLDTSYVFPVGVLPIAALLGLILALTAALAPARRAARLDVVDALAYE